MRVSDNPTPGNGRRRLRAGLLPCALAGALAGMAGAAGAAGLEVTLATADGQPLQDGVVSLHPVGHAAPPPNITHASIDQRGLRFVPQVVVVQTGSSVAFPNGDNVRHHVYSFSPAKTFELKLYKGSHLSPVTFDQPGVVALGCNIHDWMLGYIVVLDTPYFQKTDSLGRAQLANLEPGSYELHVWHPRLDSPRSFLSERIVVGDQPLRRRFNLTLHAPEQTNAPPADLEVGLDDRATVASP